MKFFAPAPGIVRLLQEDKPATIDCLMTPLEPLCYDTLCEFLPDGARAAEVGSFKGGSAAILAHGMARRGKELTLACHDLFQPFMGHDIDTIFDNNLAAFGVETVTKVKGDSKHTHAVHAPGTLDYCFVDGDHSYDGALADIQNFLPLIKPGGWLAIQDTVEDVRRAVNNGLPPDMPRVLIKPPFGHYVTVATRDKAALEAYCKRLYEDVVRACNGGGVCSFMPVGQSDPIPHSLPNRVMVSYDDVFTTFS